MNRNEAALNALKEIIGDSLYMLVCEKMPGTSLYIPALRGGYASIADRNRAIREDVYSGMSFEEAASKYVLSVPQIYKICESRE